MSDSFHTVRLARNAMATRFEIVLQGDNPVSLRAAGEEALTEIERIENQLSLYRPHTEIAHVNALAATQPVKVSPPVFALLQLAAKLCRETGGAFDVTIGPLVKCWGFMGGTGSRPSSEQVQRARGFTGMELVELDPQESTIRFQKPGVVLDLGAIGKGYAIEQAAGLLREAGVASALVHGGTSTVFAMGHQRNGAAWKISLPRPPSGPSAEKPLAEVELCDEALSVSAIWGKSFKDHETTLGHIIDPRTGAPAQSAWLAAIALGSATESDALSTALLIGGLEGFHAITGLRPRAKALVASGEFSRPKILCKGMEPMDI